MQLENVPAHWKWQNYNKFVLATRDENNNKFKCRKWKTVENRELHHYKFLNSYYFVVTRKIKKINSKLWRSTLWWVFQY